MVGAGVMFVIVVVVVVVDVGGDGGGGGVLKPRSAEIRSARLSLMLEISWGCE